MVAETNDLLSMMHWKVPGCWPGFRLLPVQDRHCPDCFGQSLLTAAQGYKVANAAVEPTSMFNTESKGKRKSHAWVLLTDRENQSLLRGHWSELACTAVPSARALAEQGTGVPWSAQTIITHNPDRSFWSKIEVLMTGTKCSQEGHQLCLPHTWMVVGDLWGKVQKELYNKQWQPF